MMNTGLATSKQAPQLVSSFLKTTTPPYATKNTTSSSWEQHPSVEHLQRSAWPTMGSWENVCRCVQDFPMYYPRENLFTFEARTLPQVQERLCAFLYHQSIQASFLVQPLSAKLQTCEGDELYLVFFQDRRRISVGGGGAPAAMRRTSRSPIPTQTSETDAIYLDVQRKKGDYMRVCHCIHMIMEVARGVSGECDEASVITMEEEVDVGADRNVADPQTLRSIESIIQRVAQEVQSTTGITTPTQPDLSTVVLQQAASWLAEPQLASRRKALESLLFATDLKQTMASTAVAGALAVLQGTASVAELSEEAQSIQTAVLTILLARELPGDRDLLVSQPNQEQGTTNVNADGDAEMQPYFADDSFVASPGLPQYYVDYMNELFHMALQVLVQSLEVAAWFHQGLSSLDLQDMARNVFVAASNVGGNNNRNKNDLYKTLLGCVGRAESKLANGYLACKALRLLALALPSLKERLKRDDNACTCIGRAIQIGFTSHEMLHLESERLWQTVSST